MDTKVLLTGIISFVAGALLVSIVASSLDKPEAQTTSEQNMTSSLRDKTGDNFDKAFISGMIMHHQDAIDMAKMAESQANHQEVKDLSKQMIEAQQKEINIMKQWQVDWGFDSASMEMSH